MLPFRILALNGCATELLVSSKGVSWTHFADGTHAFRPSLSCHSKDLQQLIRNPSTALPDAADIPHRSDHAFCDFSRLVMEGKGIGYPHLQRKAIDGTHRRVEVVKGRRVCSVPVESYLSADDLSIPTTCQCGLLTFSSLRKLSLICLFSMCSDISLIVPEPQGLNAGHF